MDTTLTSGQLELQLKLFKEKGMTPERWQQILASGFFADLCDANAVLGERDEFRAVLKLIPAAPKKLLELLSTVSVGAIARFVAADKFVMDITGDVRIACLGENFKRDFLGKVEGPCEAAKLNIHKLRVAARDLSKDSEPGIIPELGGREEITLGQFYAQLAKQGRGQKGKLLVNGYANVAYVRDVNGVLRAVSAYWRARNGGWGVGSLPVGDPYRWGAGLQVLSR